MATAGSVMPVFTQNRKGEHQPIGVAASGF
jgi:hypothetical protein